MGAEPNDGFRRVLVSSETEIKFAVEKGRKTEVVGEGTLRPSTYETLYFDTDNLDLRRNRVELCVRKRDGQVIQKIKTRRPTAASSDASRTKLSLAILSQLS